MVAVTRALFLAATLAGASAFVPNALPAGKTTARTNSVVMASLDDMVGSTAPFRTFDPLGLAAKATPEKLAYYRESELKHGRTAMIAVLGWMTQELWHPLYDGKLSANPLDAIAQVPKAGLFQIFLAINVLEWLQTRVSKLPGYKPGDFLGTSEWVKVSDQGWDGYQNRELNNGRLAMVAIMGLIVQDLVTGQAGHEQISAANLGIFSPGLF